MRRTILITVRTIQDDHQLYLKALSSDPAPRVYSTANVHSVLSMSRNNVAADDGYFNDLSRQPDSNPIDIESSSSRPTINMPRDESGLPKQKRVACVICRKRKLKCTCARLNLNDRAKTQFYR